MKVIAAYLLALLGGNAFPSAQDIRNILGSVGASIDEASISLFLSRVEGMEVNELLQHGRELLGIGPVTVPLIGISSGVTEIPGSTCEFDTAEGSTDLSDAGLVIRSDLNYVHYKGSGFSSVNIIERFLAKVPMADQFRFRSIGSLWKYASEELFERITAFPLLLIDCERCDHLLLEFTFYSAADDNVFSVGFCQKEDDEFLDHFMLEYYRTDLDGYYRWLVECSGSVESWLFVSETLVSGESQSFSGGRVINYILNPFAGQCVMLPCLERWEFDFALRQPFFCKTVGSCPPGESDCFVAAISVSKQMLGFCRPGDSGWYIMDGSMVGFKTFSDIQFHSDGLVYVLLETIGDALVLDVNRLLPASVYTGKTIRMHHAHPAQRRLHISCPIGVEEEIGDSFLVRSFAGDILLVRRQSVIGDTRTFKILQLVVNEFEAKWVDVVSISGDEAIFISGSSPSSAVSFSSRVCKRSAASSVRVFSGMRDCYYNPSGDGVCFTPYASMF